MSGWIKLHRSLIEWEWYDDINTRSLFIHCLLRANYSDSKWRGVDIKRGTFITSLDTLASETRLSVSQIRTAFRKLEKTGEIASLSQARSRVVTVLKYDLYQGDDKLSDSEIPASSQGSDKVVTADKKVNNTNNKTIGQADAFDEDKPSSPKVPNCPHMKIVEAYHECLPRLPTVMESRWAGSSRARDLAARWNEGGQQQTVDFWRRYFTAINKIDFFFDNDKGWRPTLEWLIKRKNFDSTIDRLRNL